MNVFGPAPPAHQPASSAQSSTSSSSSKIIWSLPCHLQSLTLMNCKSRAEAFARSLHSKLRYLSRATGECDVVGDEETSDGPPNTFDGGRNPYNERTHLMTTSRVRNNTGSGGDDDYDLGFYSPESPNEQLVPSEMVNDDSSSSRINILKRFNEDNVQEESGCISSVSSVLTEQDNDDDDDEEDYNYNCFETPVTHSSTITKQPIRLFDLPVNENQSSNGTQADILMPNNPAEFNWESLEKNESGFLPKTCFLEKDNLEEGQGAINFENSTKVVDIEDCNGSDKSLVEEVQTSADNDTFNEMSYMAINTEPNERHGNRELFDPSTSCQLILNALNGVKESCQCDIQLLSPIKSDQDYLINNFTPTPYEESPADPSPTSLTISSPDDDLQHFLLELTNEIKETNVLDTNIPEVTKQTNGKLYVQLSLLDVSQLRSVNNGDVSLPKSPEDELPVRVRRSSSLKTCKTPPGTPNRKKIVRFADALGLDLEDVKTVFLDDLPVVPSSAFKDLESNAYGDDETSVVVSDTLTHGFDFARPKSSLTPVFPQPGSLPDFFERVRKQSVCLESAVVTGLSTIRLVIRVLNIDFHKTVIVRYTTSEWRVFKEVIAEYVDNSNDVFSDKFHTVFTLDHLQVGERLCIAINYKVNSKEFWDNNAGQNYIFQCFPEHERTLSPTDDSWIHFQ